MNILQAWPRRRIAIAGAVILGLAALAAGAWRLESGPAVETLSVQRGDLRQSVVATGRVESPRRVDIGAVVTGTVVAVPVAEGQSVSAGTLLVKLDDAEPRAAVEQARQALAQADAKLAQLRTTGLPVAGEAARQAEVNVANAERSLARTRDLFARGFVGQAALDESQRARDIAASQAAAARLQRDSQAEGGTEVRLAHAARESARAALGLAQARLDLTTIAAPVGGVLIQRSVERGGVVQPGKTLLTLSPTGETQVVVQLDEKNLPLVHLGQAALASADAYPERRFAARVAYINPAVDALRGSVEVKLAVPEPPGYLLQDMTVSVDIEAAMLTGVLTLPAEALRPGDWVMVVRSGRTVRQQLKVGARGAGRIEVIEGLAEGEAVLPAVAATPGEGQPVRVAAARAQGARRP
jgi:HlyD family secretion protein